MVLGDHGGCLAETTVQIVHGQGLGRSVKQTACSIWEPWGGFVFDDLAEGVAMTIRVTVPGYRAVELTVVPETRQAEPIIIMPERL
jgi:hypothetical protein